MYGILLVLYLLISIAPALIPIVIAIWFVKSVLKNEKNTAIQEKDDDDDFVPFILWENWESIS